MNVGAPTSLPVAGGNDLEQLRKLQPETMEQEKARLRLATKEFESFFVYYMLKNMRKTVPENPFAQDVALGSSAGKEIFTDMFDMEVARNVTSGDGRSISEILYSSLEGLVEARYPEGAAPPDMIEIPRGESGFIEAKEDFQPVTSERFIQRPRSEPGVEVSPRKNATETDPIMQRYGRMIERAADESNLDSALIAAVIQTESSGNPKAVSKAGAKGLMQLRDGTAREMGVKNAFDPEANIRGGSKYLRHLLDRFGDLSLALAAYNAGPGTVERHGGVPPFKETRDYIVRVTKRMAVHATHIHESASKEATVGADKVNTGSQR